MLITLPSTKFDTYSRNLPLLTNGTCRYQHFEFSYIKDLAEPSRNLADSTGKRARKKEGGGGEADDQEKEKDAKDK